MGLGFGLGFGFGAGLGLGLGAGAGASLTQALTQARHGAPGRGHAAMAEGVEGAPGATLGAAVVSGAWGSRGSSSGARAGWFAMRAASAVGSQ